MVIVHDYFPVLACHGWCGTKNGADDLVCLGCFWYWLTLLGMEKGRETVIIVLLFHVCISEVLRCDFA